MGIWDALNETKLEITQASSPVNYPTHTIDSLEI